MDKVLVLLSLKVLWQCKGALDPAESVHDTLLDRGVLVDHALDGGAAFVNESVRGHQQGTDGKDRYCRLYH